MWKHVIYDDSYFDKMIEMSIENYGPENDICNKEFIQHQYYENPAGDAYIDIAVDPDNGTLAGQYIVNPAKFRAFGKDVDTVTSLNTLTRKAYRGQKIFIGLAETTYGRVADNGVAFVYGAPNQNSYHGFVTKLSFDAITEFPLYAKPLHLGNAVTQLTGRKPLGVIASPFGVLFPTKYKRNTNIQKLTKKNNYLMDEFWDVVKDKYPVMGVRDAEYIAWRYLSVPRRKYYPFIALKDGKPVAFAVGRIREVANMTTGMIADFLYVNGNEKIAAELINTVVMAMKHDGANLAGCVMLRHTDEAKILKKCGFIDIPEKVLPQPTPLILRVFDEGLNKQGIKDIYNWFFTTGDYDVV